MESTNRGRLCSTVVVVCAFLLCLLAASPPYAAAGPHRSPSSRTPGDGRDADFNGDGFADIALGDVFNVGDTGYEGAVHVMYGTATGLTSKRAQLLTEDTLGGEGHRWDYFGGALAAADFDGDAFTDLAIGIPQGELDPPFGDEGSDHGLVRIAYGSPLGLGPARSQLWSYKTLRGGADLGHHFGEALTAGNYGKGPQDDLAISANNETVAILHGGNTGLQAAGHQLWSLDSPGIAGTSSAAGFYGASMVSGHFDRGDHADLAIGIPDYTVASRPGAGAVSVMYGSDNGLSAAGNQLWTQNSPGVAGRAERDDSFGAELAAGKLNGTGFDALAIGVPAEDIRGKKSAGAVNVIYGSASGLRAAGDQIWTQASRGIPGTVEGGDEFGSALSIGNYGRNVNGRAYDDLAVGAYAESIGRVQLAGSVTLIYGSRAGLHRNGSRAVTQKTRGVPGKPEYQAMFGGSLGSADVGGDDGSAFDELLINVSVGLDWRTGDPYSAVIVTPGSSTGLNTRQCEVWTSKKLGHLKAGDDLGFGEPILA